MTQQVRKLQNDNLKFSGAIYVKILNSLLADEQNASVNYFVKI